jgi:hypothetical protein
MNNKKTSNPVRLIAFFLTAVILTTTFGFTVDGWGVHQDAESSKLNNNLEENPFIPPKVEVSTPEIYIPPYVNRLTGEETTVELSKVTPKAFVMETDENNYGLSRADILVEIPIENERTRFISIISDTSNLWKIGAIKSTRGYIDNIAKFFGAIPIYNGNDDKNLYDYCNLGNSTFDLSINEGFSYTEFSSKTYTNCQLIDDGFIHHKINNLEYSDKILPFTFNSFENSNISFDCDANIVKAYLSNGTLLQLTYNEETKNYSYIKNGKQLSDSSNGQCLIFKNCLVLFADSITYDNSSGSQLIMNTIGNGDGYYITEGSYTQIKWNATSEGIMNFYLSTGEKLTVNRGKSYICYLKSSTINDISFS